MNTQEYLQRHMAIYDEHRRYCGSPLTPGPMIPGRGHIRRTMECAGCGTVVTDQWPSISNDEGEYVVAVQWSALFRRRTKA